MAKDTPNPDDFFGPGASTAAPAEAKRTVNPDDYFGKTPEPAPPKPTLLDKAKSLATGAMDALGAGAGAAVAPGKSQPTKGRGSAQTKAPEDRYPVNTDATTLDKAGRVGDSVLRPEFVDKVRSNFAGMPESERLPYLKELAQGTDVYARAARQLLPAIEQENAQADDQLRTKPAMAAAVRKAPSKSGDGKAGATPMPDLRPTLGNLIDSPSMSLADRSPDRLEEASQERAVGRTLAAADGGVGGLKSRTPEPATGYSLAQAGKDLMGGVEDVKSLGAGATAFGGSLTWAAQADALKDMDAIDAGATPALRQGGVNAPGRATDIAGMYANADPETRAKLRDVTMKRLMSSQEFIGGATKAIADYSAEKQRLSGAMPEFTDVRSVSDFAIWAVRNGIATSPTMAVSMVGALVAGVPGLLATGAVMATGDMTSARAEHANKAYDPKRFSNPDRAETAAAAQGGLTAQHLANNAGVTTALAVPYVALDLLGPAATLAKQGLKAIERVTAKGFAKKLPGEVAGEMINEGGQEVVNVSADMLANERPREWVGGDTKRVVNAAAVGGLMGVGGHAANTAGQAYNTPERQMAAAIDTSADLWGRYFAGKPDTPDAKGFTKPQAPTVVLKESLNRFDELAAAFGLNPAAAAAVREQAGAKPAGDVPGFLARVTGALNKRGMFQRPVDDAGVQQLDEAINGAPPAATAPADEAPLDAGSLLGTPIDEAPQDGDMVTGDGQPYGTRAGAQARATREGGGNVVEVAGGWVVRSKPEGAVDDQSDLPVPAAVVEPAGAAGGAVPGGSGTTVEPQLDGGGAGVGPAADAPVPGGGAAVSAGSPSKPNAALSDTPDYEASFPRPPGGKNSQFNGLEDDEPTLTKAVAGVHKQARDDITASLKAAHAADQAGDKAALGEALTEVDGALGEYADEFGPENAKAFQAKVAPDLETLRTGPKVATFATPEAPAAPAPTPPGPVLQNRDRSTPGAITQMKGIAAAPDYTRLGFSRDFTAGAPVVAGGSIPPAQLGRKDTTAAGDRKIPVQYAVVEAADVLASNDSDGVVNKAYGSAVDRIRAIAGNGRIAGLQGAYAGKKAGGYRTELEDDALHGIDPEVIRAMKSPVLVRVMPTSEISDDIGDVSNIAPGLDLSAVEQAKNDARRVNLDALEFTEDGEVTPQAVRSFVQAMPQAEQQSLIDTDGSPTRQAVDRLNAAIFSTAYDSDALVRLYAQATDPEARNVMSALAQAAPSMARLAGAGALDIRGLVTQAAEQAVNARRRSIKLADMAAQVDMSADPDAAPILALFAASAKSVKPIVEALRRAADFAYDEATKDGTDMFGAVERATRADVLDQLRTPGERGSKKALEDQGGRQPDGQDAVGRGNGPGRPGAPGRPEGSRPGQDAGPGATTEGARPGLTLEAPTPEGLRADAERQAAADKADAAEQKRLADKARADADAGDFVLTGSSRPADVAAANGQSDIFSAPQEQGVPLGARDEALIDLRKRASILKSLRECLG